MISERDSREFAYICADLAEETLFSNTTMKLDMIAYAQTDARLEFLLRAYINQEGEHAAIACEELAVYTEEMMRRIQHDIPAFDMDDMQMIVSGVRTRIEGVVYE